MTYVVNVSTHKNPFMPKYNPLRTDGDASVFLAISCLYKLLNMILQKLILGYGSWILFFLFFFFGSLYIYVYMCKNMHFAMVGDIAHLMVGDTILYFILFYLF